MKKRKYSAIVFDLGNVLIPFDYSIMRRRLDEVKPGLGNEFYNHYMDNYEMHRDFERGKISEADFISAMLIRCNGTIDEKTFCRYYSEVFRVDEDVASLLPKLKEKYKLVLLSNTNSIHQEYGYKQYEFLKYFDKLILSYQVGAVKPEPEIYKAVEMYTELPAEEHIFIDDVAEYADGARNAGWDAIHFTNYEQLVKELKLREIL